MDTPELLRPQQLVGKIKHVVTEELKSIDTSITTPEERNRFLLDNFEHRKKEFQIGSRNLSGFAVNAIEDMWLISRGAFNYLQLNRDDREELKESSIDIVARSVGELSIPAIIPTKSWEYIKNSWSVAKIGEVKMVPENKFQLREKEGLQIVGFSSGALTEIDSYFDLTGDRGCPAKGLVLNSVFEKYIETIFKDTLLIDDIES